MTHDERSHVNDDGEVPGTYAAIDALLDGELVERHALRSALDDEAARDYLVDALLLRQMAREMDADRVAVPSAPRRPILRDVRWLAAAVTLIVGASVGYVYGQGSRPAATSSRLVEVVLDAPSTAPPAPEPTRTIRFEPGVNWSTRARSH